MKSTAITTLLILTSVLLVNAQTKKKYRDEKVERELIGLVRMWDAASVNHDAATLDRLLAEEFTLSGTPKAQYLVFIKSPDTMIESAISDKFDVRVYKDIAVLIARDTIKLHRKGVEVIEVYRYIDVWMKREGRWQCVATESYQIKKP